MNAKVNANPTKEFFISMLTRDVDIKAAILELIDNSIDGAKRLRPDGKYDGLWVKIQYDKSRFQISDNCGGIPIKVATEYAFRFGRPNDRATDSEKKQYYTGAFGIGMKRSLFRLGSVFSIESFTKNEHFSMSVDVNEWVKNEDTDWSFELSEEQKNQDYPDETIGTTIVIPSLNENISKQLSLMSFENDLIRYIESFKTTAVENGLQIIVNGTRIDFIPEHLFFDENIVPYVNNGTIGDVSYKIIAGLAPKGNPEKAGWYISCNGRLVVYADKTSLTGWGEDGVRHYHPSLAFFRGFIIFESVDSEKLPWNTSKTSIDTSSVAYIGVKPLMREATGEIIKACLSAENEDLISDSLSKMHPTSLVALNTTNIARLSTKQTHFSFSTPEYKERIIMKGISYQKSEEQINKVKGVLKVSTNKDVGSKTFDYFFERECLDDE